MAIHSVIFDLGKVIVDFTYDEAYSRMQALSGLGRDEINARLYASSLAKDFEMGRIGSQAFVGEVNRRMGTALSMAEFAELWSSVFHQTPLIPASLLERLRRRYRLVLLSNTNPLHFQMIRETYPHIAHFDALVLSHEVGAMKPDPAIYRAAIDQANCAPRECLFFDDMAENVQGARAAGMNAEQFLGLDKLRRDLTAHGIEIE